MAATDPHSSSPPPPSSAFTLLELLTVIAIIGILAAIALPNLKNFKPNVTAAATRQLLDDVGRARRLAISQRTTVYMVFVPTNYWQDPRYVSQPQVERDNEELYTKQLVGYNFVSLKRLGSQPGSWEPAYLSEWRTLPAGAFIVPEKFGPRSLMNPITVTNAVGRQIPFVGFRRTTEVPFPTVNCTNNPFASLPYIAFNYLGQLEYQEDEYIPLALGNVGFPRDPATKQPLRESPSIVENPRGNSVDSFNIVHVDWLTGRARVERVEIR